MSDPVSISVRFASDKIAVEFPDEQTTTSLALARVSARLFRIESVPVMVEAASFGDTIEADPAADGSLRFVRVAQAGGWRTFSFLLSARFIESAHIAAVQARVLSLGGRWEQVFGGMLFLCLPPAID